MKSRNDVFLDLSSYLTGFDTIELIAIGLSDHYLKVLDSIVPASIVDNLLEIFGRTEGQDASLIKQTGENIMNDPALGPVARNLILLWYQGVWTQLSDAWRAAYGITDQDYTHVISSDAYLSGLQWLVAGAHPSGGKPQGFASWSNPV